MKLLYKSEHIRCDDYDLSRKPLIEVIKRSQGTKSKLTVESNEIVFITEGHVRYYFREQFTREAIKGQIVFRPAAAHHSFEALTDVTAVLFRIKKPIVLCHNYTLEKLYDIKTIISEGGKPDETMTSGILEMNPRIWYFLNGVTDCIADGLRCSNWFNAKITEFFTYLRIYYTKAEIRDFFVLILSGDTAFSEYVRMNRFTFKTVGDMASSVYMSNKQFSRRFQKVFGQTPYSWILDGRGQRAYDEIINTNNPFQQIAHDHDFNSDTQFTRFFKQKYGKTPTDLRKEFSKGEEK